MTGHGGARPRRGARYRRIAQALTLILTFAMAWSTAGCALWLDASGSPNIHRDGMRAFVVEIARRARTVAPGFLVVPQNGEPLLTIDGEADGPLAAEFVAAIDGLGREDLFYGYTGDDVPTPPGPRAQMLALLDLAESLGIEVLVTDYCSTPAHVAASVASNEARGYASFAAPSRGLDTIPQVVVDENGDDIVDLSDVRTFLYLIDPSAFADRADLLDALRATAYDLLIVDRCAEDGRPLAPADVASLQVKPSGGRRLALAYLSIGEAEDYRAYWDPAWADEAPSWIGPENPDWPGNYLVRYGDPAWQEIVFGLIDEIVAAGFDGVYLDKVDAYESFEE